MVLEKNLEVLSNRAPDLALQIREVVPSNVLEVVEARSGLPVLKNQIFLHSVMDPQKEGRNWANRRDILEAVEANKKIAVFGLGMGYHIKELLDLGCPSVTIIEPDMAVLRAALECVDFTQYLDRITLLSGSKQLPDVTDMHLVPHRPTVRLHREMYLSLKERSASRHQSIETFDSAGQLFKDEERILAFIRTFPPDEIVDIEKLADKIPLGDRAFEEWEVAFLLMREMAKS
ncbi:MAG: hypothetical protein SV775_11940 [Thermodesulfobacteriota bacterium]|nr:hypothetical protein [Thermodesulfobacteriota bacterium]